MRAGKTKTTSFSLDAETMANLKALAARWHNGNVSALLADWASREAKFAAAEAFLESCGSPVLTSSERAAIEAEWRGDTTKKPKKSKRAA